MSVTTWRIPALYKWPLLLLWSHVAPTSAIVPYRECSYSADDGVKRDYGGRLLPNVSQ